MTAPLLSVLYTSNASEHFDDDTLDGLLTQARSSNRENDLTGMLLYRRGRFVQVLEGPEDHVRDLLAKIAEDSRHVGMRVLIDEPISHRNFADWTMGYQRRDEPSGPPPPGYRDSFTDLDESDDPASVVRAARELSLWFRVRAPQQPSV